MLESFKHYNIKNVGEEVTLTGWVSKVRNLGGLVFIDLRNRTGIMQVVVRPENEYDQSAEFVFYIEESPHDQFYYSVLPEKGVEMELSMPLDSMGSSDLQEFNMFASVLGFKTKETKDSFILSGKITPETASMMGIDFSELNVELDVEDDGIYLLGDYYQKQ